MASPIEALCVFTVSDPSPARPGVERVIQPVPRWRSIQSLLDSCLMPDPHDSYPTAVADTPDVELVRALAQEILALRSALIEAWDDVDDVPPVLESAVVTLSSWGDGDMLSAADAELVIAAGHDDERVFGQYAEGAALSQLGTAAILVGQAALRLAGDNTDGVNERLVAANGLLREIGTLRVRQ